jgi:glycosyltransferase involved in cell wall biosynthesis
VDAAATRASVSVVIPCHNAAAFIRASVESALAQTTAPLEVVVVDDASTDVSREIIKAIPGVTLLALAKGGVSNARNEGLRATSGPLVLFHDADDRLLPNAVEAGVQAFAAHPECGFVYGFATQIDADGAPMETAPPEPVASAGYATLLAGSPPAPPSTVLFRRTALEVVGGFDAVREPVEDVDMYLRVARKFPVHCHGVTITEYRRHGENVSARSPSRTLRAAFAMLEAQREAIDGDPRLLAALDDGKRYFRDIFGESLAFELADSIRGGDVRKALSIAPLAARSPRGLVAAGGHFAGRLRARVASRLR